MTTNKTTNDYDLTKKMLNKIREIQATVQSNTYGLIKEQMDNGEDQLVNTPPSPENFEEPEPTVPEEGGEKEEISVINDVEIVIHSEDPEDLALDDEEKQNISQLIDEFRKEVSEVAEFDKLHVYSDSAKLDGKIGNMDLNFSFSTGDDTGVYLANTSMLKIDDESFEMINKLRTFQPKFSNTINNLLVNRKST